VNALLYEYAVVKYSPGGVRQWAVRQFGSDNTSDQRCGIAVDGSGNLFLTGCSGYATSQSLFTSKYNSSGDILWTSMYNTPQGYADCEASAIVLDSLGNSYVTGFIYDPTDVHISGFVTIKYNPSGVRQWLSVYNSHCYLGKGIRITIDPQRNLYVCGYAEDSVSSDYDFVTLKYGNNGNLIWNAWYNGPGNNTDLASRIVLDRNNNVYVSGWSMGEGTESDFAVIKYSQLTGVEPISSVSPKSYSLSQNYPNPFNPKTTIRFSIPLTKGGDRGLLVKMTIYDVLGREVATLVHRQMQPGSYSVDWYASNYPTGAYFYKLEASEFTEAKKMVLIK
jgi:hypothetical protein